MFIFLCLFVCFVSKNYVHGFRENENLTTVEIIERNGYPCETHKIITQDGYVLTLHRIPHGKTSKNRTNNVVFLQHCLLCSSAYFVLSGPERAIGFILADAGYDVWMGNARGNYYSRQHTKYNPDKDTAFWNFSLDELGTIDLPESIDYVLNKTNESQLYFIGHSQGCTSFYIMVSSLPEYNSKIRAHISLAPVVYLRNIRNLRYKFVSHFSQPINMVLLLLRLNEIFPKKRYDPMIHSFFFQGSGQPAGTSRKVIIHYAQQLSSGRFQKFNDGLLSNLVHHHTFSPPNYDLSKVTVDVWLFQTVNDWIASEEDIRLLSDQLIHLKETVLITDGNFSHMDFVYGENARKLVYSIIIDLMNENYT